MVEIKEIKKEVPEEELEDQIDELEIEDEGGIFDEDMGFVDDSVSDFDIGSTMLASAPAVESWANQNLEDTISREHVEKDWGDDEDFVGSDVYHPSDDSGSDVYGAGSDVYGASSGSDVYGASGGSDAYNSGKGGEGAYATPGGGRGGLKSYDQIKSERKGESSMLESMGFEDKQKKQHKEFTRDFVAYDARKAA